MKKLRAGTKVYVSGPISIYSIEQSKAMFDSVANILRDKGMLPVTPFDSILPDSAHWKEHMKNNITLLFSCQAVVMMPNWEKSSSSRIEQTIARESRMKVLYYIDGKIMYNELHEL